MFIERQKKKHGMSLVPMIDVLLCLLIFFMLSSSFVDFSALKLNTAKADSGRASMSKKTILMATLVGDDHIIYAHQSFSFDHFLNKVVLPEKAKRNVILQLKTGAKVSLQSLVNIQQKLNEVHVMTRFLSEV